MTRPSNRDLLLALVREAAQAGIEAAFDPRTAPPDPWCSRHQLAAEVARDTEEMVEAGEGWSPAALAVLERMVER